MKKENTISFLFTNSNHILIECEINYVSGIFIVDTGASNSCINYLSASKFNLEFKNLMKKHHQQQMKLMRLLIQKITYLKLEIFKKMTLI